MISSNLIYVASVRPIILYGVIRLCLDTSFRIKLIWLQKKDEMKRFKDFLVSRIHSSKHTLYIH